VKIIRPKNNLNGAQGKEDKGGFSKRIRGKAGIMKDDFVPGAWGSGVWKGGKKKKTGCGLIKGNLIQKKYLRVGSEKADEIGYRGRGQVTERGNKQELLCP